MSCREAVLSWKEAVLSWREVVLFWEEAREDAGVARHPARPVLSVRECDSVSQDKAESAGGYKWFVPEGFTCVPGGSSRRGRVLKRVYWQPRRRGC